MQGTVVRLTNVLRSITFATTAEHREHLASRARRRSVPGRVILFLRYAASTRTLDANTLRYLWIEAGFDAQGTMP